MGMRKTTRRKLDDLLDDNPAVHTLTMNRKTLRDFIAQAGGRVVVRQKQPFWLTPHNAKEIKLVVDQKLEGDVVFAEND